MSWNKRVLIRISPVAEVGNETSFWICESHEDIEQSGQDMHTLGICPMGDTLQELRDELESMTAAVDAVLLGDKVAIVYTGNNGEGNDSI